MARKEAEKAINIAMPRMHREKGGSTGVVKEPWLKRRTTRPMVAAKARLRIAFPMSCSWNIDDDDLVRVRLLWEWVGRVGASGFEMKKDLIRSIFIEYVGVIACQILKYLYRRKMKLSGEV